MWSLAIAITGVAVVDVNGNPSAMLVCLWIPLDKSRTAPMHSRGELIAGSPHHPIAYAQTATVVVLGLCPELRTWGGPRCELNITPGLVV